MVGSLPLGPSLWRTDVNRNPGRCSLTGCLSRTISNANGRLVRCLCLAAFSQRRGVPFWGARLAEERLSVSFPPRYSRSLDSELRGLPFPSEGDPGIGTLSSEPRNFSPGLRRGVSELNFLKALGSREKSRSPKNRKANHDSEQWITWLTGR